MVAAAKLSSVSAGGVEAKAEKCRPDAAGGLSREAGQWNRGDGCGHIELEETAVHREDHHQGQHPDEQRSQQCHRPEWDRFQKAHIFNDADHLAG